MRLDYKITRSILKKEETDGKSTHSQKSKRSKKKGWLRKLKDIWNMKEAPFEINGVNGSMFSVDNSLVVNGSTKYDSSSTPKEEGLSLSLIDSSDGTISSKHDVNEDANPDVTIRYKRLMYNVGYIHPRHTN